MTNFEKNIKLRKKSGIESDKNWKLIQKIALKKKEKK